MTHFTVAIIIPPGENDIHGFIDKQMQPYDENLEVPPYPCYSIEQAAKDLADEIHRLELIVRRKEPMYDIAKCEESIATLRRTTPEERYRERLAHHEEFDEDGEPFSTYNPDSKWDWYVIGGRWDGWVNDRDSGHESLADNLASTEDIIARRKFTHAIITPDGEWHERGHMGWWASLLTENEDWDEDVSSIFARFPGHQVVIIDAHI